MQPSCIPSPMVIQDDDHQFGGGEKQAGLRPLPHPQLQGSSSSVLGRRARQVGACLRVGRRPAYSSGVRGRGASSSCAEEASSSHAGEGELLLLGQGAAVTSLAEGANFDNAGSVSRERHQLQRAWHAGSAGSGAAFDVASCRLVRAWLSVHRTSDCRVARRSGMSVALPASPTALGDRLRHRTPLGRRSCSWIVLSSLQHDASARRPVSARPQGLEWGSAGAGWGGRHSSAWRGHAGGRCRQWRGGGSQRRFLRRQDRRRHLRSDPRLFGFDGLSSPLVWGRGPFHSSVCPEVIAAAVLPPKAKVVVAAGAVVASEPPGVCCPAGPLVWRLFIPAGVEPESRL
jgi:hypothetical protein